MEKIQWMDWSPAAFERAQAEDKLVLLDIGAVWCHWCHVMDQEAYSNADIIKMVNEDFLPIRVDNDERPDVNERYNQGGWPTTVVMTPEGLVVFGATYLPPESMREALDKSGVWYAANRDKVDAAAAEFRSKMADGVAAPVESAGPIKDFSQAIIEDIRKNADTVHGGFGTGQKFPYPGAISLALGEYYRSADALLIEFVEKTLRKMAKGLIDHEEGGLFRYSVTREWNVPHYEKNLDVNALCLRNYLDAYRVTGKREFAEAAEEIIGYMLNTLSDGEMGGFYGSQDADIFDEESQRILMDGEDYFQLTLARRKEHGVPYIDKTIYTNWNALAVSAFLEAYHALDREDCRDFALKTLRLLMERCRSEEHGTYHLLRNGTTDGVGLLTDGVALARANLDAYETTGEREHLGAAERLMGAIEDRLRAEGGGYYDSLLDENMPPATRVRHRPLQENLWAAEVLARLHAYTMKPEYLGLAKATLAVFEKNVESMLSRGLGYLGAEFAVVTQYVNDLATKIAVVGSRGAPGSLDLLREAKRAYRPAKLVQLLDTAQDMTVISAMNYGVDDAPTAYVCEQKTCSAPIKEAEKLRELLAR